MSEQPEQRQADQDPAPLQHSDAERVADDPPQSPQEIDEDPAQSPDEQSLRDVKGG